MKYIVTVCLTPSCIWVSLPWPARLYWHQKKQRCPRCKGRTIVTDDPVLMDLEWERWMRALKT